MIELFIVGSLVVATVRTAKGRGSSPWLYGSMAVLGFLLLRLGLASVLASLLFDEEVPGSGAVVALNLAAGIVPYLCPVLVYFYVRSVPGRSHAQPAGQWTCQECRWLNSATVFKCEACGSEYQVDRLTT
jgi:hypothetical protein